MYCINCGNPVDDSSKFCPICGIAFNQATPNQPQVPSGNPITQYPQAPVYPPPSTPQPYNPPTYAQPMQAPANAYAPPTWGNAKVKNTATAKKRNTIIVAVAALLVIGAIAGVLLLGGGGNTSKVTGKVTDAEAYINGNENAGLENVKLTVLKGSKVISKKKTNATGEYAIDLKEGAYTLTAEYEGYVTAAFNFDVGKNTDTYLQLTKLVANSDSFGTVSGQIINSLTGEPVIDATIKIKSSTVGSAFVPIELVTDDQGSYIAELPAGYYSADINVVGFSNLSVQLIVIGGRTVENQNGALTPILEAGQLRIVLTWGENPLDLDSHFTGPSPQGRPFHIFYNHKTSDYNGEIMTELDLDDTTSYGPETTTIYKAVDGTYSFYVHDYSNRDWENATALANSGAVIQIYAGDSMIGQYNVPTNLVGTTWHVFDFVAGEIIPAGSANGNLEELNSDVYDSGWTRIAGDKIPVGVSYNPEDFTSYGFTENSTLLDFVDLFGLPEYYDSIDALRADMEKGALYREEEDDNPMGASWASGKAITYARFEPGTWKVKYVYLDIDILALPYSLISGMSLDEVVSAMKIGSELSEIGKLGSRDDVVKYCQDNQISGKDFEDGYVQVFLTNGAFSYEKYTYDVDGFDELDYYLDFYSDKSIFSLTLTDGVVTGASLSFTKPPQN